MDLSETASCKFRNPTASFSTLPELSCNPSGPYLPVSQAGISLSCSHAKHHSSSLPNSLSVIKCKVAAAVVKWRGDVKTGALVNTDSVVELCCFPSRPVYLFQSINHNSRPTSFCFYPASLSYIGVFVGCAEHKTDTNKVASWRHKVLLTAPRPLHPSSDVQMCVSRHVN